MSRRRKLIRINAAGAPVAAAEAAIAALSPVGWYKFNEGTGTAIVNYGSTGATDALAGGGTGGAWVAGGHDSEGTAYFTSSSNLGISGTAARTLIAVASKQTAAGAAGGFSAQWLGDGGNGKRWSMRSGSSGGQDFVRMEIQGQGFTSTTLQLTQGAWAFAAMSQPAGGTTLAQATLYLNALTEAGVGTGTTIDTTGNFGVGRAATAVQDWIVGYILVYPTQLSGAQIAQVRSALTTIMAARGITLP